MDKRDNQDNKGRKGGTARSDSDTNEGRGSNLTKEDRAEGGRNSHSGGRNS